MNRRFMETRTTKGLIGVTLLALLPLCSARGQNASPSATVPAASNPPAQTGSTHHYQPDRFAGRAATYYTMVWGVDSLSVKWTESGELIRFSYRVLDPAKAKILNDEKAEPQLLDPTTNVKLVVPTMEKVGKLRQTAKPEAGRMYWMAFSNKGQHVKRGDHVDIVIGQFRADGLVVD